MLGLSILCATIYGFSGSQLLGWLCLLLGLGVVLYTGIFLGTMRARPFWNGPALPILFLLSGLSTGIGMQSILVLIRPLGNTLTIERLLRASDIGLLVLEIIVLIVYVLTMRSSATVRAW